MIFFLARNWHILMTVIWTIVCTLVGSFFLWFIGMSVVFILIFFYPWEEVVDDEWDS